MKIKAVRKKGKAIGGRNPPLCNYSMYEFTKKEYAAYTLIAFLFIGVTAYLFYDSALAFLLLLPLTIPFLKKKKNELCRRRVQRLELEFRDVILSVASNIQAGYSIENAFGEAYREIVLLYGNESVMACELSIILRRLANNASIEELLTDLAKRSGAQDIKDFADIFQIAKRGGGNMQAIIADTAQIIGDKQAVRMETDTIMSEKRLEQTIMRYIPFFIIVYISITSKGYFEVLYHNISGQLIMTAALGIYGLSCMLADKILNIEV